MVVGAWAWLPCGTWGLPGAGIEPTSPALTGGFFTTEPPGNPCLWALGEVGWAARPGP